MSNASDKSALKDTQFNKQRVRVCLHCDQELGYLERSHHYESGYVCKRPENPLTVWMNTENDTPKKN